jgi:hypothetical protein
LTIFCKIILIWFSFAFFFGFPFILEALIKDTGEQLLENVLSLIFAIVAVFSSAMALNKKSENWAFAVIVAIAFLIFWF